MAEVARFFPDVTAAFGGIELTPAQDLPTVAFLDACEKMVKIFESLGAAFSPVKSDMNGNIEKLRKRHKEDPIKFATMQDIVNVDIANNKASSSSSATCAMLWFKRGLHFVLIFLQHIHSGEPAKLNECANIAYVATLKKHHNFMVKGIFAVALKAAPNKADFTKKLGPDEAVVLEDMAAFVAAYEPHVKMLIDLFNEKGLEK